LPDEIVRRDVLHDVNPALQISEIEA